MSAKPTTVKRPYRRRLTSRTMIVCLPGPAKPELLPDLARTALADYDIATHSVVPHFAARTWRGGQLVDRWQGLTCGGPLRLLDLERMRRQTQAAATLQWQWWRHVVADTRPAHPFWVFVDRYRADPGRYPLARARADYQAQPRLLAMSAFNAMPHKPCELPTASLEAFQAGHSTYLNLAWLAAVPGDGLAIVDGPHSGLLTCDSERLADQLTYLRAANEHLSRLDRQASVVAVAV
ncbi:hypothetical protein [Polymorphospora sp. NPDC050346]|uniref:hypothetical protein n=1 Tax=Polymorphospora sp. NPDC050346 TaxID=3155780 RepID=UPI0033EA721C